jgi:short-subunit dehydrogenase
VNQRHFLDKYGPWAVVTGASDGIGLAFSQELASIGLNLVLVARRADRLFALSSDLRSKYGTETVVVPEDLSTPAGLATVERATAHLDVGLLVAAAGYGTSGPLLGADLSREHNMLELNCFAVLQQVVVFGNRLTRRQRGGIILMSSLVGWQGVPQSAHYAATKAYVQSLAEALRFELKPRGVDVLASAPGPVHSGFAARAGMRMGAAATPASVAKASIRALGRKGTVLPGRLTKLLTYSLLPLPRTIRTIILAKVMGGMTKHQTTEATA